MQTTTRPTIDDVLGTLDELAAATRRHERDRYTAALEVAHDQGLTNGQIRDCHEWGNRTTLTGWAPFDWTGTVRHV